MDNLFLTVLLIIGIVILAIPKSVSKTVKKALPIILVFLAVSAIAFLIKGQGQTQLDTNVKIIATGTKDKKAEGTEIFIKKVIINGKSESPVGVFSSGWIEKDGGLLWRDYDQPDNIKNTIYICDIYIS